MEKNTIFGIFIVMILTNATRMGWIIEKINNKKFILRLKKNNIKEFDLVKFIDRICDFTIESY
jgi:hypothetical protein